MTMSLAEILDMAPKAQAVKEQTNTLEFIKIKAFRSSKDVISRGENDVQNTRKCLNITYLPRVYYLHYTESSYTLAKTQTTQLENGQRI